jgi:hypothetical protein
MQSGNIHKVHLAQCFTKNSKVCEEFAHVSFNIYATFPCDDTIKIDNLHIQRVEIENYTLF